MNKPITPEQMSKWIAKTWKECQERAWSNNPSLDSDTIRSYNNGMVKNKEQQMKIELTQTQAELLDQMVQEEIMRVESVRDLQYRSQILASLRSLKNKLEKTAPAE